MHFGTRYGDMWTTNISRAVVREIEEKDEFPHDLVKKFCDLGLAKVNIPEAYGGLGGDIVDLMIIFEEIAKKLPVLCWNLGNILLYGNEIIGVNGNQEQKDEFFPKLARGEIMFSFAITEPNAGSDAAGIKTKGVFRRRALCHQRRQDVYYRRGGFALMR